MKCPFDVNFKYTFYIYIFLILFIIFFKNWANSGQYLRRPDDEEELKLPTYSHVTLQI